MAVNLIDDDNSDSNVKSETPSLVDPDLSDDEDSDDNNDDDTDGDKNTVNHVSVSKNANLVRQERVNPDDEDVINHISVMETINLSRQETIIPKTSINVTPGGRTQIV